MNLPQAQIQPGAGIIIVKKFPDGFKVLGLFNQEKGMFDLPKGEINLEESTFQAAVRETQEECGITKLDFKWGMQSIISVSHLTFFLAETDEDPVVTQNPATGILEHLFAEWMEWDELEVALIGYLIPALREAQAIVEND
jgi:8-oxo-dGTP pyrophosphatase MutT (NUDIX family)